MGRASGETVPANTVTLRGRVSSVPEARELPSGRGIVTVRLVLARDRTPMTAESRQKSDWVDCVAWDGRVRHRVLRWRVGDIVRVDGALRRRFFRTERGAASRVEVEILGARIIERAG